MADISFAKLTYSSANLGDDIQSLATVPFIGEHATPVDRESLANYSSEKKMILLMNGWWADEPAKAFPPAPCFEPVFIGFHIARRHENYFLQQHCLDYFKKYQPIGCRDEYTKDVLERHGIKAFFSGCLSTTFDKRKPQAGQSKVLLVDTMVIDHLIPDELKGNAIKLTHEFHGHPDDREFSLNRLLKTYHEEAALVITTRLHAALFSSALGIPVVFFFNKKDTRASTAAQIGLKIYNTMYTPSVLLKKLFIRTKTKSIWSKYHRFRTSLHYTFLQKIDWNPPPLDIEMHKLKLKDKTKELMDTRLGK